MHFACGAGSQPGCAAGMPNRFLQIADNQFVAASAIPLRTCTVNSCADIDSNGNDAIDFIWERNYLVYRRVWKVVVSGFFEPVFYLFSIGIGIGALVPEVTGPGGVPIAYTAFVAPALMAASAMNGNDRTSASNAARRSAWRVIDRGSASGWI